MRVAMNWIKRYLLSDWPSLGQGNHSIWTSRHHDWFHSFALEIASLKTYKNTIKRRLFDLDNKSREKDAEIAALKKINQLEKSTFITQSQPTSTGTSSPFSWSDLMQDNKKPDAVNAMLAAVKKEDGVKERG